jgi:hypothetical protein
MNLSSFFFLSVFAGTFFYHTSSLENVHRAKLIEINGLDGISDSTCLLSLDWTIESEEEESYYIDLLHNQIVKKVEKTNPVCRQDDQFYASGGNPIKGISSLKNYIGLKIVNGVSVQINHGKNFLTSYLRNSPSRNFRLIYSSL